MALKIVLLALLVCCAASEAQCQGDDTSLPLTYDSREVVTDFEMCPDDEIREEITQRISSNIHEYIQDKIFPSVLLSQGWTRVAYLDMTNSSHQCPTRWETYTTPKRACGRNAQSYTQNSRSVFYPTNGVSYSHVCGRVIAYQYCRTNAFYNYNSNSGLTIDNSYVHGVSITHGSNPREHVWTFAAAHAESHTGTVDLTCPCTNTNNSENPNILIPPFVGDDYFCDSGTATNVLVPRSCSLPNGFFPADPLWDGEGCGPTSTCCEFNNPPWFCKTLPESTTDDIEVRLCGGGTTDVEDTPVELIELYVY